MADADAGRQGRSAGWWVVLGLATAPLVAVGIGRFAYALVLPAMRDDLSWSYGVAGSLNSAIAIGYLVGALTTTLVAARFLVGRVVPFAVLIVVLTLVLSGVSDLYGVLLGSGPLVLWVSGPHREARSRCGWRRAWWATSCSGWAISPT